MMKSDDDNFQKKCSQKNIIHQASSENLKRLDDAITDYNIAKTLTLRVTIDS